MTVDSFRLIGEKPCVVLLNQAPRKPHTRTMNKIKLIESVQKELGSTKADAERAVNAVIEGIKSHLKKSKVMQLVGFGTFKVVHRKGRLGVNPKTGERIKIKPSKGVKFGAGKDLKSKL
jgi:DNA-binding protein HU-beta